MKYETKDYHIGVIFPDDTLKQITMLTCKRLGVRISSVYQALHAGKGVQTSYDTESYKLLWKVWTLLRKLPNGRFTVANARQEALNAVKDELEWLERGAAPIYCHLPLCVLCNVDIDDDGEKVAIENKEERLVKLENLIKEYITDPDAHERISNEIDRKINLRMEKLMRDDEEFRKILADNYSYEKSKNDSVTEEDVAREMILNSISIPDKLTMRARFDERPLYKVKLDKGVSTVNKRDSMSKHVRSLLSGIVDVRDLTDASWRMRVEKMHAALVPLYNCVKEEVRKKKNNKEHTIFVPDEMVKTFSDTIKQACNHSLWTPLRETEDPSIE